MKNTDKPADFSSPWLQRELTRRQTIAGAGKLLGVASLADVLASCGTSSASSSSGQVTIGTVTELSGTFSLFGPPIGNGIQIGADFVNKTGGILGKTVKVIVRDSKSDAAYANQQVRQLVQVDKVDFLFGLSPSNLRDAALPFIHQSKTIYFYPANYEGGAYDDYMFCVGMLPSQEFNSTFIKLLINRAGGARVYHVGQDFAWPRGISKVLREVVFPATGVDFVGEDFVPLTSLDISPIIPKIISAKPDVVLVNVFGTPATTLQHAAAAQGLTRRWVWAGSTYMQATVQAMGADADGAYRSFNWNYDVPGVENANFVADYQSKFPGQLMIYQSESAFNVPLMLQAAAKKAGSLDKDAMLKALPGTTIAAPSGPVTIRDDHHCILSVAGYVTQGGTMHLIESFGQITPAKDQRQPGAY